MKDLVDYTLIGHSERRKNFLETDEILFKKVEMAKSAGLKVIYCVPDAMTKIPENVEIVAYEPITAIGSGNPDTPENASTVARAIKNQGILAVLYGGSVTSENVHHFTKEDAIDGVLVGGASLKPVEFSSIIASA
jgi:triosephosphate isomerase